MGLHLIDALKWEITKSVWNFVEMHCHLTSLFCLWAWQTCDCENNSEISGGRPYILQTTFPARGQINNVFRITGKSGMNMVFFARPKTGKRFGFHNEILTKVASISFAFETTIVVMTSLRWFLRNEICRWMFLKLSLNILYQVLFRKIQ